MKKHIEALLMRQKHTYITSIDESGFPVVKIVNAPRKRDGLRVMYLTTPSFTNSVQNYKNNNQATVYFVDEQRFQTALFFGTMEIETDEAIREAMKKGEDAKIFSNGILDSEYSVLRFTAQKVRFFSNLESIEYDL